jgi:hypothetical protein
MQAVSDYLESDHRRLDAMLPRVLELLDARERSPPNDCP